jgi:hypothetical protein
LLKINIATDLRNAGLNIFVLEISWKFRYCL